MRGKTGLAVGLRTLVAVALASVGLTLVAPSVSAHSPHDDIFDLAVSPQFGTDGTIVAISRGLFVRSTDAGETWQRLVKGLDDRSQPRAVAYAGGSSSRVWAVSGDAAFRSDDGGVGWKRMLTPATADLRVLGTTTATPDIAVVAGAGAGASITRDGGVSWQSFATFGSPVTAVAFKKASSQVVFAGDASGTLHTSGTGGASWFHFPLAGAGSITSITPSPAFATDGIVLLGTSTGGVLRWNHTTKTATPVISGLTDLRVTSVGYSANYGWDGTVFASTWTGGVHISTDRGLTWGPANDGLVWDPQPATSAFSDRPNFGKVTGVVTDPVTRDQRVLLASFTGIYASDDLADTWQPIETLTPSIVVGLALSPEYGTNQQLAISTYLNGAFTSTSAGSSWSESNVGLAQPAFWNADPDAFARLYNIVYAPPVIGRTWLYSSVAAYGNSPGGVLRSSDGGASWKRASVPGFSSVDADTHVPFVLPSPAFATDHAVVVVDAGNGYVSRSVDEGATFVRVGTIPRQVRCLQASPTYAVDHRLLACTTGGIYVSTDLGATWTPTKSINATGLAVVSRTGQPETWLVSTSTGLYRSTNLGALWTRVTLPSAIPSGSSVVAVAASPPSPSAATVLVSVRGRGLLRSTDGGATFGPPSTALLDINEQLDNSNAKPTSAPIAFSPAFATDATVFGYSNDHLFKSTDGGVTWGRVVFPRAVHTGPFPVVPAAPLIESATRGNGSASISFTPGADGGAPILRYDGTCTSTNGGTTGTAFGVASPVVVAGLTNGKTYTCRVTATNGIGVGPASAPSSTVVPATVPGAPPVPTAVGGTGQATVSWTEPADTGGSPVTGYVVTPYVGYFVLPSMTFPTTATTQTLTGLASGTSYRFAVAAINAVGTGPRSQVSNAVVPG